MIRRSTALILISAALAAFSFANAAPAAAPAKPVSPPSWVYYAPETPLDQVPIYQLRASSPVAMRNLEAEIDRLYAHAKTLPSGPDRRTFQTRIYLFEKRLRPLWISFNATAWETLRADVRAEWVSVQDTLPLPAASLPASATSAPLAAKL